VCLASNLDVVVVIFVLAFLTVFFVVTLGSLLSLSLLLSHTPRELKFDLEGSGRSSLARAIEDAYQFSSRALLR
jgi:hypothetical protein